MDARQARELMQFHTASGIPMHPALHAQIVEALKPIPKGGK